MSQFSPALDYVLNFEDEPRSYEPSPDCGGFAIAGVNSIAWPEQYKAIAALPQPERAAAVAMFYQQAFWTPIQIGGIQSQDVANRVLDQSVNGGSETGPLLLQRAANACGCTLAVDGNLGPNTFEAVNGLDPERLLAAFRSARVSHYEAIVTAQPDDERYLVGWLNRAKN